MKHLSVLFVAFTALLQASWADEAKEAADRAKFISVLKASEDKEGKIAAKKAEKEKRAKRKYRNRELPLPNPSDTDRAAVKVEGSVTLAPFKSNVQVWGDTDRYSWTEIPPVFKNFFFTQFDSRHQGVTEFEVRSAGRVYLVVTSRWGEGGNSSGGWVEELTSEEEFLDQGWKKVAKIGEGRGDASHGHHWVVYQRNCEMGERFRLRTEKYCAPILLF